MYPAACWTLQQTDASPLHVPAVLCSQMAAAVSREDFQLAAKLRDETKVISAMHDHKPLHITMHL